MKQYLIATALGVSALALRDRLKVTWAGWMQDEAVACFANDALATRLVTRLCRPGMVFVDVGAHIGSVVAQVMRHCPTARIEAAEACPVKCASLRRRFPRVKVHAFAVGDIDDGFVEYFEFPDRTGCNTTVRPKAALVAQAVITRVPMRTLDTLIGSQDVDVLKIDVEGAEAQVLEGGRLVLEHSRPTVMFESSPDPYPQSRARMALIFEWFDRRGYAVLLPDRVAHLDDGLTLANFIDSHVHPRRSTNYFAVAKEKRSEIRVRARQILGLDRTGY
jgi:FkbM family methyltransferase